jgi:5S rRNA maturation endonuclease (ribonuclease M5)
MDQAGILKVLQTINKGRVRIGPDNIYICCPLAKWRHKSGEDSHPSLAIKISKNGPSIVHCFGCKFKGSLSHLIRTIIFNTGLNYKKLLDEVELQELYSYDWTQTYDDYLVPVDENQDPSEWESAISLWRGWVHPYMESRHFTDITHVAWEIGVDKHKKTIVLPIRDKTKTIRGAVGRFIEVKDNKYYNYWHFTRRNWVLGLSHVIPATTLIVVEGALDAPKMWQFLFQNNLLNQFSVVSTLGSEPTKEQASRIVEVADRVLLMLDNDIPGQAGQEKLRRYLKDRAVVLEAEYPSWAEGYDPDKLIDKNPDAVRHMLAHPKFNF